MSTVVPYVWRGTSRPPHPRHDVAGPSLNMDLFKAEICGEAGPGSLGGSMVREEEPAT
jgi:hypothetical protein